MPTLISHSPEETHRIAADLAASLQAGAVLALHGDLGAGKTCFVQGLARGLGVARAVTSPTYTLVAEHPGRLRLYHIDLYRIRSEQEALNLGIDEYLFGDGVTALEWAERIAGLLPPHTLHIRLAPGATDRERIVEIGAAAA